MTRSRLIAASSLFATLAGLHSPTQAASPTPEAVLVASYNATGERLFQDLAKDPGNIVMSPYSVGSALSMVLAGARGETAAAIAETLDLHLSDADLASANSSLIADLKAAGGKQSVTLNSANALIEVKPGIVGADYRALLRKSYGAEIFPGDLNAINRWVSDKTAGKIPHILSSLPDQTGFVLANAAYFKAVWDDPFDKKETKADNFYLTAAKTAQVQMMHNEDHFQLVTGHGYKAIRLPYNSEGGRLGMIVAIPDAVDGLDALIAQLGPQQVKGLFASLDAAGSPDVQLEMPRFHADFNASLAEPLQKAGMAAAFDGRKANFHGMTTLPVKIAIGDVIHSAVIDVNEESSEAAAATVVPMVVTAMAQQNEPSPIPFVVNHPFLFFIADRQTGAVLFQGRISDPRS
jgi:serpin B